MVEGVTVAAGPGQPGSGSPARGETAAHTRLKRLALIWAQARGYSACAVEVSLPRCRFRADIAAYRPNGKEIGSTAVFECKQAFPDLRRDNGCSAVTTKQLEKVFRRREVLEKTCGFTIRRCAFPTRFSPTSIHTTMLLSTIAVMPAFSGN